MRREEARELRGRVVAGARATGLGELAERDELRAGAADVVPPRARGLDLGEEVCRPRLAGGLGESPDGSNLILLNLFNVVW